MIFILSPLLILAYFILFKSSIFGFSLKRGNYLGFFILYTLVIHIIPAVILLNLFPIKFFYVAYKVQQSSIYWISMMILLSVFLLYFSLFFWKKVIGGCNFTYDISCKIVNERRIRLFVLISLVCCIILMIIAWSSFHIKHAFLSAIFENQSVSIFRTRIRNADYIIRQISNLFIFITPFLTAIVASPIYRNVVMKRMLAMTVVILVASWSGNKSSILSVFIVFLLSYVAFENIKMSCLSCKNIVIFVVILLSLLGFTYLVVSLQYHLSIIAFFKFLVQRVFVGEIIGVYSEFNLWIHDPAYILHAIPFMNFFTQVPNFQKELMLISENIVDSGSIGIKNTLFIAEAYAIGGWLLLIISPIIWAFSFILSYRWIFFVYNKFLFRNKGFSKIVTAISMFSYVQPVGGLSDLLFFKITIMMILYMFPFLLLLHAIESMLKKGSY